MQPSRATDARHERAHPPRGGAAKPRTWEQAAGLPNEPRPSAHAMPAWG